MIASFRNRETQQLYETHASRRWSTIRQTAIRKLDQIEQVEVLEDLRYPPGNRLEALRGDRQGQHSIRINDQWRICFIWQEGAAHQVEIVDYH